tara:strand:+ start:215 stop:487 length:273 start_codon:yes stop_codon:yes gene_type:complete
MDNRFLNKVLDQIVSETRVDYSMEEIQFPFSSHSSSLLFAPFHSFFFHPFSFLSLFMSHCKEIYGLNEEETIYVWKEYVQIIKDKIRNNG